MVSTRPRPTFKIAPKRLSTRLGPSDPSAVLSRRVEIAAVALLVAYALAARLFVAVQLPPWQGPDEPKHFEYIRMLIDMRDQLWSEHRLLRIEDGMPSFQQQVIASMARNHFWRFVGEDEPKPLPASYFEIWQGSSSQLHRPSLYYFAGALILAPFVATSIDQQLLIVRAYSAVLGACSVLVAYAVARTAWRNDPFIPIAAAAFVAALPMSVFVGAIANVDNMAILIGGLLALGLARGLTRGYTKGTLILIVGGFVLGVATKREFVGVVPGLLVALVHWLFYRRSLAVRLRDARVIIPTLIVVAAAAGAGVALNAFPPLVVSITSYALNEPNQVERLLHPPLSTGELVALVDFQRKAFFSSFWGVFGWFSTFLSRELETILKVMCLLCAIGVIRSLVTDRDARNRGLIWLVSAYGLMIATMTILAIGIALSYFVPTQLPQGRHIFGTLIPIALLFGVGTRSWLPASRFGTWVIAGEIAALLVWLDVTVYRETFAPYFLGHF
jgi:hypothetical protein